MRRGGNQSLVAAQVPVRFRRGFHPEAMGYRRITHRRVIAPRADRAWKSLVANSGRWSIERSPVIAQAMGVSEPTSRLYRRVFDSLGLVSNVRGCYNAQKFNPGDWDPDLAAENIPAIVTFKSMRPEAFGELLPGVDVALYVASIDLPAASPPVADLTLPSSLRSSGSGWSPRSESWWHKRGGQGGYGEFVSRAFRTDFIDGRPCESEAETIVWETTTPPPVLVITRDRSRLRAKRAAPPSLQPGETEVTVTEVMEAEACSRATAYRQIQTGLTAGTLERVKRGRYRPVNTNVVSLVDGRNGRTTP